MEKAALDWDHLRTFLAVLEHGSLSGAAAALRLTQPTAGRHIAALETALATPLFIRSFHGLLPTPTALELRGSAEAMQAAAAALVRTASGEAAEPRGTVRITASEVIGAEVLPPILAALHRQHPAIVIELAPTNRAEDLTRRVADIAVRMHRPTQGALVARRLGRVGIGLFAHRDYLAAHGTPRRIEDLASHSLIGFDRDETGARSLGAAAKTWRREMFRFRSDSDLAQLAALRAGFGIGGCQLGLAERDPRLLRVLERQMEFGLEMWLVMHEDLRLSRRVRLVYDHLVEELLAYVTGSGAAARRPGEGSRKSRVKRP